MLIETKPFLALQRGICPENIGYLRGCTAEVCFHQGWTLGIPLRKLVQSCSVSKLGFFEKSKEFAAPMLEGPYFFQHLSPFQPQPPLRAGPSEMISEASLPRSAPQTPLGVRTPPTRAPGSSGCDATRLRRDTGSQPRLEQSNDALLEVSFDASAEERKARANVEKWIGEDRLTRGIG